VLVTGGSGFIGSHVVDKLVEHSYDVRVFDKIKPRRSDVDWFQGDLLNDSSLMLACRDVDIIFHLAAIADVNVGIANPELCLTINETGLLKLLTTATAEEVNRVVLASTTWVYGRVQGVVDEDSPVPMPDHIYTKTKIGQEHLLYTWHQHYGLPYTILRYDIPYGPRMRSNLVIAVFVKRALEKKPITVFGDGNQGRCFVYVEDLAEGNVAALQKEGKNEILNLAGSEFITVNEIVNNLKRIFGKIRIQHEPARPSDFRGVRSNIEKAERLLGWKPRTSFQEGLQNYVDYAKGNEETL